MAKKIEELGLTEDIMTEVAKLIQAEGDRVRTEYTGKLKDLEQYKPKEKSQQEIEFETRLKALEEREQAIKQQENISNITNKLSEKGLPTQLAKYLQGVEDIETSLGDFESIFTDIKLNNSFKPQQGFKEQKLPISKEQFAQMNYRQRAELEETNNELYNTLASE